MQTYNLTTVKQQAQAGFTLIELLIVVAILGILAAIGIPQYQGYQQQARINGTQKMQTNVTQFLQEEFAKCSAGATNYSFDDGAGGVVACADALAAVITDFEAYALAQNWNNPFDPTLPSVVDGAPAGVIGTTYVEADTPAAGQVTVTTLVDVDNDNAITLPEETIASVIATE